MIKRMGCKARVESKAQACGRAGGGGDAGAGAAQKEEKGSGTPDENVLAMVTASERQGTRRPPGGWERR